MTTTPEAMRALRRLIGTEADPNIGWRGNGTTEVYACEFCNSKHGDCTKIEHTTNCPVPRAFAAIATLESALATPVQPAAPHPTPLPVDEIKRLYGDNNNFDITGPYVVAFARAIEAAHGIKAQEDADGVKTCPDCGGRGHGIFEGDQDEQCDTCNGTGKAARGVKGGGNV